MENYVLCFVCGKTSTELFRFPNSYMYVFTLFLQDFMKLVLLTIRGEEHQGTPLRPFQIISLRF